MRIVGNTPSCNGRSKGHSDTGTTSRTVTRPVRHEQKKRCGSFRIYHIGARQLLINDVGTVHRRAPQNPLRAVVEETTLFVRELDPRAISMCGAHVHSMKPRTVDAKGKVNSVVGKGSRC